MSSGESLKEFYSRYETENENSTDIKRAYYTGAWTIICILGHAKEKNMSTDQQRDMIGNIITEIRDAVGEF